MRGSGLKMEGAIPGSGSSEAAALRTGEEICRCISIGDLLEGLRAVFFDGARKIGEHVAIEKDSVSRAKHPFRRRTPGQADSRAEIVRVLIELGRQMFEIVAHAQIDGECDGRKTNDPARIRQSCDREIHVRIAKGLPKLIRISREKIGERSKQIYTAEAVGTSARRLTRLTVAPSFHRCFALRASVGVVRLIVIFAALDYFRRRAARRSTRPAMSISGPRGWFVRATAWRVAA